MDTYDLDIENYELDDILTLFHVTGDFTKEDLKKSYRIALKMHPDKSSLPKEYFIFFMRAYQLLRQIYEFRHREDEAGRSRAPDTDLGEDERIILENLNLNAGEDAVRFNRWFNNMFDKVKVNDGEQDSGYEHWFRDASDTSDMKSVSLSQFDNEFEKHKQDCKELVVSHGLSDMGGTEGYDLLREKPTSYAASIFSKLPYEDLKKAHTETVIPVTKEDYLNKPRFSNVESYRSYRDGQNISPPSLEQSKRFLAKKGKESAEHDVQRIYTILKQDEGMRERNKQWWGYLKQLKNE